MLMIIVVSNDSYRLTCTFCALCPRGEKLNKKPAVQECDATSV
ncbi:MAG: hypothetical protein JWR61_1220 [Ferruginibacter sp.]|nr:hypothetical protein [Ferruginibacter sp.]